MTPTEASMWRQHAAHLKRQAARLEAMNHHEKARIARAEAADVEARLRKAGMLETATS